MRDIVTHTRNEWGRCHVRRAERDTSGRYRADSDEESNMVRNTLSITCAVVSLVLTASFYTDGELAIAAAGSTLVSYYLMAAVGGFPEREKWVGL